MHRDFCLLDNNLLASLRPRCSPSSKTTCLTDLRVLSQPTEAPWRVRQMATSRTGGESQCNCHPQSDAEEDTVSPPPRSTFAGATPAPTLQWRCGCTHPHAVLCRPTKTTHCLGHPQHRSTRGHAGVTVTTLPRYPTSASPLKSWESDLPVQSTRPRAAGACWKGHSFVALRARTLLQLLKGATATEERRAAHADAVLPLHFLHKRRFQLFSNYLCYFL